MPQSPADQKLLEAINDPNIRTEIFTTKGTMTMNGDVLLGGSYEGSKHETVTDENGRNKNVVITKQVINFDQLNLIGTSGITGAGTTGDNVRHEILESFIGGQLDPGGNYASGFINAHTAGLALDPTLKPLSIVYSAIDGHTYLTSQNPTSGIDFSKEIVDMGKPERGYVVPSNPRRTVPDGGSQGGKEGKTNDYKK